MRACVCRTEREREGGRERERGRSTETVTHRLAEERKENLGFMEK